MKAPFLALLGEGSTQLWVFNLGDLVLKEAVAFVLDVQVKVGGVTVAYVVEEDLGGRELHFGDEVVFEVFEVVQDGLSDYLLLQGVNVFVLYLEQ